LPQRIHNSVPFAEGFTEFTEGNPSVRQREHRPRCGSGRFDAWIDSIRADGERICSVWPAIPVIQSTTPPLICAIAVIERANVI
jgi:hypothetical protein